MLRHMSALASWIVALERGICQRRQESVLKSLKTEDKVRFCRKSCFIGRIGLTLCKIMFYAGVRVLLFGCKRLGRSSMFVVVISSFIFKIETFVINGCNPLGALCI